MAPLVSENNCVIVGNNIRSEKIGFKPQTGIFSLLWLEGIPVREHIILLFPVNLVQNAAQHGEKIPGFN